MAEDVGGIAVHIAERGGRAAAREALVSSTVKDLVAGSGIRLVNRGEASRGTFEERWLVAAAR